MIAFLIGFLLIPSVLGSCTKEAGDFQDGTCSDSCFVWRGPNEVDISLNYCSGDDVSDFIRTVEDLCEEVLGRPDYADDDWDYFSVSPDKGCNIGIFSSFTQKGRRNLAARIENRQIRPNLAVSKVRRQKKNRTVPSRKTVFAIRINQLAVFAIWRRGWRCP